MIGDGLYVLGETGVWLNDQRPFDLQRLKVDFSVRITSLSEDGFSSCFDMANLPASFANAIRRIVLSELPTICIEKVFIYNNTSIIQDEYLAHRLGLIPLKVDPNLFEYRLPETEPSENDSLKFVLKVKCSQNLKAPKDSSDPDDLYVHHRVLSEDLKWMPIGNQRASFCDNPPAPVYKDILIAKLRPGHEIELETLCVKGIGQDHAKFSPVATASYRLLPVIRLNRRVLGDEARLLQSCFAPGVIELRDDGDEAEAVIGNVRLDDNRRQHFQHDALRDALTVAKQRDHFIFSVESTGIVSAHELVLAACQVMIDKCRQLSVELEQVLKPEADMQKSSASLPRF